MLTAHTIISIFELPSDANRKLDELKSLIIITKKTLNSAAAGKTANVDGNTNRSPHVDNGTDSPRLTITEPGISVLSHAGCKLSYLHDQPNFTNIFAAVVK